MNGRRSFLAAIAGLFAFGAVKTVKACETTNLGEFRGYTINGIEPEMVVETLISVNPVVRIDGGTEYYITGFIEFDKMPPIWYALGCQEMKRLQEKVGRVPGQITSSSFVANYGKKLSFTIVKVA